MLRNILGAAAFSLFLSGCVTASMEGYADKVLPTNPIRQVAAFVNAPLSFSQPMQARLAAEGEKSQVVVEDALSIFPPTRTYSNNEVTKQLKENGVDAVLVLNVGDSGVVEQYAGTILSGNYTGTSNGVGSINTFGNAATLTYNGTSAGTYSGYSAPIYRPKRQTSFNAKLIEPQTGRTLWVGNGEIDASGKLFVGVETSASKAAESIFADWRQKGIIATAQ